MPQSLDMFHFNSVKLGQILRQIAKDKGISKAKLKQATGISRDTLGHIFSGETQEVSFEKLFKLCYALETPVSVVEYLMLKDEDIDFAEEVLYYDPSDGAVLPAADVDPSQLPVTDAVVAVAEAAADAPVPPVAPTPTQDTTAFLQAHIDRLTALLELALQRGSNHG